MILKFVRWYLWRVHDPRIVDGKTLASLVDTAEWAHIVHKNEAERSQNASIAFLGKSVERLRFTSERNYLILPGGAFDN